MIVLDLPWPPKELFPNAANRRGKGASFGYSNKARSMRTLAWGLTVGHMQNAGVKPREYEPAADEVVLRYELTPPNRSGPVADEDNVLSALKAARDGIADALGVNDKRFRNERPVWREREGVGSVKISFE